MPTVYYYPVKLTIADLIHAKNIYAHRLSSAIYNKPIIDLACSVCTVKYQSSVFLHGRTSLRPSVDILKNLGLIRFHSTDQTSEPCEVNKPLLSSPKFAEAEG
jgi:hypothetical protein